MIDVNGALGLNEKNEEGLQLGGGHMKSEYESAQPIYLQIILFETSPHDETSNAAEAIDSDFDDHLVPIEVALGSKRTQCF